MREGRLGASVARSILQARQSIAPAVSVLAGEAPTSQEATTGLRAALATLEQAGDSVARQHAALAFRDAVIDAADSLVFRLLFNGLQLAYEPAIDALGPVMEAMVDNLDDYRSLTDAVLDGDPVAARRHSEDLLRPATEAAPGVVPRA